MQNKKFWLLAASLLLVVGCSSKNQPNNKPKPKPDMVIEDGTAESDADLAEQYAMKKYSSSSWEDAQSISITLNNQVNGEYTEGNCVALNFTHQGYYFMYEKGIEIDEKSKFEGFGLTVKSDASINMIAVFQINRETIIQDTNLTGVHLKYRFNPAPTVWTKYEINFDDENWLINYAGMDLDWATVKPYIQEAGVKAEHIGDLMYLFDAFQIRVCGNAGTYASCHTYLDDVKLIGEAPDQTVVETLEPTVLAERYIFQSDAVSGNIVVDGENSYLKFNNGNVASLRLNIQVQEDKTVRVSNDTQGYSFDAVFTTPDAGKTLVFAEGTGHTELLANGQAMAIEMVEDFEGYSETGVGYDQSHGKDSRSGLRGDYYCDYYSGGSGSPVGGSGWSLMGSSDYLALSTTGGYSGAKAMDIKHGSNTMRFMNYGFSTDDGIAVGYAGVKALCFWLKGHTGTGTLSVRVYYQNKVTASTQQSNSSTKDVTITANMGWVLVTVPLNASQTYYGYSLTSKSGPNPAQRLLVDDICYVLA